MWQDLATEQQERLAALLTRTHEIAKSEWPAHKSFEGLEFRERNQLLLQNLHLALGENVCLKILTNWRALAHSYGAVEVSIQSRSNKLRRQAWDMLQLFLTPHAKAAHLANFVLLCPKAALRKELYDFLQEVQQQVLQQVGAEGLGRGLYNLGDEDEAEGREQSSYRMTDPEGDSGVFNGSVDSRGNAHGRGMLQYDDGNVFAGRFVNGAMNEGVCRDAAGREIFTMRAGEWTDRLDGEILEQFKDAFKDVTSAQVYTGMLGNADPGAGFYAAASTNKTAQAEAHQPPESQPPVEGATGQKGWEQYSHPSGGYWWYHEASENWFMEDDPGAWKLTTTGTGQKWWWNDQEQDGFPINAS